VTVTYGANSESVTISASTTDRTLINSDETTDISITATPAELPANAETETYTLTLLDPCVGTDLTEAIPLDDMTVTALRVLSET
jgi:hypothetical protein